LEDIQWNIGNGNEVHFWSDSWQPLGVLLKNVTVNYVLEEQAIELEGGVSCQMVLEDQVKFIAAML